MGKRRRFSRQQVTELWDRWCGDESLETIAAALQVSASGAFGEIRRRGGIPPRPATRRATELTLAERHVIERARGAETSMRAIGADARPGAVDDQSRARAPWPAHRPAAGLPRADGGAPGPAGRPAAEAVRAGDPP